MKKTMLAQLRTFRQRFKAIRDAGMYAHGLFSETVALSIVVEQLQADRKALRDSIVGHMCHERDLLQEISSLKRHLNMAIEERDQARKRKKRA